MLKIFILIAICLTASIAADAQAKPPAAKPKPAAPKAVKKVNQRPAVKPPKTAAKPEPFEKATVEEMAAQCVKLETEAGAIELEMYPESAPESVRGFLNLAGSGALDTTVFNRVVPGFVIQGGDLFQSQKMTAELDKRARRKLPDEPNQIKHERGILSMARLDAPDSATTDFFILLMDARTLDGKFAAFGRVTKGMETVEAINKMPVLNEKPDKPVRITKATVAPCAVAP